MYTSIEDFKNKKGEVNWKAYHKAQVDAGEKCVTCGAYIMSLSDNYVGSMKCGECKRLYDKEEIDHSKYLRCPDCKHTWEPYETEDFDVLDDGDHEVSCPECGTTFTISTSVSYNFTSPELLKEKE